MQIKITVRYHFTPTVMVRIKKNQIIGASLVAQWLRICLPIQGNMFKPWSGKISHAAEQLSLCATTTEARALRARAPQQEKPPQ